MSPDQPRQDAALQFRSRLAELIARSGLKQSRFAARAGLDRSTLSQLMAAEADRLPRAETVAAIARAHGASADWLLGLSEVQTVTPDVVAQAVLEPGADDPANEQLKRWHAEAAGAKIRYVPSTLPDQLKTDAVMAWETARGAALEQDARLSLMRERIAHARRASSEIEVCMPVQALELFAEGRGVWKKLSLRERLRQIDVMADLAAELYPAYRLFLFDGRETYSAPYTVFGAKRAALYIGGSYIVFTSAAHIKALTHHFDDLIRKARIQPDEAAQHIRKLRKDMA